MRNLKSLLIKIGDKSILFFSRVSLSKFFLEVLFLSWVKWVFILRWEWNVNSQIFQNKASSRLDWVVSSIREVTEWPVVLFYPVVFQLAWRFNFWHAGTWAASGGLQPRVTHEIQSRVPVFFAHSWTLSHSLPLQESHLNTELLIAEIQANLARNKSNKMVDKVQPYILFKRRNCCLNITTKHPLDGTYGDVCVVTLYIREFWCNQHMFTELVQVITTFIKWSRLILRFQCLVGKFEA